MYLIRDTRYACPKKWGKLFWDYMFAIALHTKLTGNTVKKHFELFACLIPCALCRCHFTYYLKSHPPPRSGMSLFRWIHTLKNIVNKRQRDNLGLKKPDLQYETAVRRHKKINHTVTIRKFCQVLKKTIPRDPQSIPSEYRGERRVSPRVFRRKLAKFTQKLTNFFKPAFFFCVQNI